MKIIVSILKVVAWVGIVSIGYLGAYATLNDLFYLHPAWQWPTLEVSLVIFSFAGSAFLLKRKIAGFAFIVAGLVVMDIILFSTWNQGVIFANVLAVVVAIMVLLYAYVGVNEYRHN